MKLKIHVNNADLSSNNIKNNKHNNTKHQSTAIESDQTHTKGKMHTHKNGKIN